MIGIIISTMRLSLDNHNRVQARHRTIGHADIDYNYIIYLLPDYCGGFNPLHFITYYKWLFSHGNGSFTA